MPQFQADPRFKVVIGTTEGETILGINNTEAAVRQSKVRQAITHAIDRKAIIDGDVRLRHADRLAFPPHNPAYVDLTGTSATTRRAKEAAGEAGIRTASRRR